MFGFSANKNNGCVISYFRIYFRKYFMEDKTLSTPVAEHRKRRKRQGFVRVEVQVRKDDAPLIRKAAAALSDPARSASARALLRARFDDSQKKGLKALLAAAPLDDIELERPRDSGRTVDL